MSVLYKALQKAAKDNEQRQPAQPSFDPERLAGSGAIRSGGQRSASWRIAGIGIVVVFVGAMGAALYLTSSAPPPPTMATVSLTPPTKAQSVPAPTAAPASLPTVAATVPPAGSVAVPAAPSAAMAPAPLPAAVQATSAPPPASIATAASSDAGAPTLPPALQAAAAVPDATETSIVPAPVKSTSVVPAPSPKTAVAKPSAREAMPQIAADSPARMLSPPISVRREQFALSGVGNAVQVRRVSQEAQDEVGSGYKALIRSDYQAALGFYDQALRREPNSVLGLLGRASALQKLGRSEEARVAYDAVLKIDPANREALINITGLLADRQPGDALKRLLELEAEYPNFSPITAQIGMTYAKMDNLPEALDFLNRAASMTPDAVMYHYNVAVVLDRMKLAEQAAASYQQVLRIMNGRNVPELSKIDIERRVQFLSAK